MKLAIVLAITVALAACATPAPPAYGPAARPDASGYSDTRIESDRYRVTYTLPRGTAAQARDYALLRAAELTLANDRDWFQITQRDAEESRGAGAGPRVSLGVGGASFGGRSATGVGAGIGFNLGGADRAADARATLEFRMGVGAKPASADAYDAREVQQALRPPG